MQNNDSNNKLKHRIFGVAADVVIFTVTERLDDNYRKLPEKELRVLLIKRKNSPNAGRWALPGGFIRADETAAEAAARILSYEAGVSDIYMEQLFTYSAPDRDPRMRVASVAYMALIDSQKIMLSAGGDAADAAWFTIKRLGEKNLTRLSLSNSRMNIEALLKESPDPEKTAVIENESLAFDHAKIIIYALKRLRTKVEYTDIAFNLLGPLFSLTELQHIYEVILGRQLLAPAFRRKIADHVEETEYYSESAGHRPSKLYKKAVSAPDRHSIRY